MAAAVALLVVMVGSAARAEPDGRVFNIRVGQHPDKTRVVLDLSRDIDFFVFLLPDPYRIVVDLPELAFELPANARSRPVGRISGWRHGLFEQGTSRLVIDATEPMTVKAAFVLPPSGTQGHRLVLDLVDTDRPRFISASNQSVKKRVALRAPRLQEPPAASPPERTAGDRKVVVIDPGHGGVDPGALGPNQYEKAIVLATAKALKRELEKTGRYTVVMTRDRDIFVRLRERVAIARGSNADLFVSLHADTIDDRSLRGLSVYTLSETASDTEAELLATHANKSDIIAGMDFSNEPPEVTNILIDLAQRRTKNLSVRLAGYVVDEMERETKLLGRAHRFAGFAVLKAPDVPSILIELGFLSNKTDARTLSDPKHQARIAWGIARSIDRYFQGVQSAFR
ncbi:MAG: N-acetylmuramoyl-L-alanine amidase [Alphaproteobacteria bacterium]|nr:N-acetylmuramoyl-L-alanine amidase [Alphaproteobacteria bacterium]